MHLISAVIITYNEEKTIGRCIDSLKKVADEIIVVDSFSTDRTVYIAKSKGAMVELKKFAGYIPQKNNALAYASHDYVLSLDADEELSEELVNVILAEKNNFSADAYYINRCTSYCGKFIKHGSWYPDKKIRLFNRHKAKWGGHDPHEKIELNKTNTVVAHLKADILHYSFPSIDDQVKKSDKYSSMSAKAMYARGAKSNLFKMLVNPCWTFFYGYILRLGFLDGFYGFVIAINNAHATFLKYAKLYHLQHCKQPTESKPEIKRLNNLYSTRFEKGLLPERHEV